MVRVEYDMEGRDHHSPILNYTVILAIQEFKGHHAVLCSDIIAYHLPILPDGDPYAILGLIVPLDCD